MLINSLELTLCINSERTRLVPSVNNRCGDPPPAVLVGFQSLTRYDTPALMLANHNHISYSSGLFVLHSRAIGLKLPSLAAHTSPVNSLELCQWRRNCNSHISYIFGHQINVINSGSEVRLHSCLLLSVLLRPPSNMLVTSSMFKEL